MILCFSGLVFFYGCNNSDDTSIENNPIVFQDNFDQHPDWQIEQPTGALANTNVSDYGSDLYLLDSYYAYYTLGTHFSQNLHNSFIIESANARGGTGKAITCWQESDTRADSGGGWASDGQIGLLLDQEYEELYMRFYIRFQHGWQYVSGKDMMMKIFRVTHFRGGSPFSYFNPHNHQPLCQIDLVRWMGSSYPAIYFAYRYETNYYPDDATPYHTRGDSYSFDGVAQADDGEWHCWEMYVKMNSAVGVADGVVRMWQDGLQIAEDTTMAWSDEGSQESLRLMWNYVVIGGNDYNHYARNEDESEQWYAIDDLVISTEYIGPD